MGKSRDRSWDVVPLMQDQIKELIPESTRHRVQRFIAENGTGYTSAQIAKKLGVSATTVRRHIRGIARDGTMQLCQLSDTQSKREADVNAPNFVLETQIDVLNQLQDANGAMWELIEQLEKVAEERGQMTTGEINAYIRSMGEIRQQLQLQANLVELMLRLDIIKEFQQTVLETINEVDPKVAEKIRIKLLEKKAMRSAMNM